MAHRRMNPPPQLCNADCLTLLAGMPAESVDCVVTDPPYKIVAGGVRCVPVSDECGGVLNKRTIFIHDRSKLSKKWRKKHGLAPAAVKDGKMFEHNDIKFSEWLPPLYRVLKKGTHCYIMINARNLRELQNEANKAGFVFQNLLVWNKGTATPNKYYMQSAEFILMLSKRPARNINDMGAKTVIDIPNIRGKHHPTEKPAILMAHFILNSTNPGDVVLDPFMGVGGTGVACYDLDAHLFTRSDEFDRHFIGCEIDKEFYDIAVQRITG